MDLNQNPKEDISQANMKLSKTTTVLRLQTSVKQPAPLKFNVYDCINSSDKQLFIYTTSDDDDEESNSNSRDDSPNVQQSSKLADLVLTTQTDYVAEKPSLTNSNPLAKRKLRKNSSTASNSTSDTKPSYHQQRILLNKNDLESSTDEDVTKISQQTLPLTFASLTKPMYKQNSSLSSTNVIKK
jgi:hypothetical protein